MNVIKAGSNFVLQIVDTYVPHLPLIGTILEGGVFLDGETLLRPRVSLTLLPIVRTASGKFIPNRRGQLFVGNNNIFIRTTCSVTAL